MTSEALRAVRREIQGIDALPYGRVRSRAAEALVRRLEAEGPEAALPGAYNLLVRSLVWNMEPVEAFVPFVRQLRLLDERPELFEAVDKDALFWSFRWMAYRAIAFPEVSFEQVTQVLVDMRRRHEREGLAMDAVRLFEYRWALERELPEAEELFWAWVHTPRRPEETCPACDASNEARHLVGTGRPEAAVRRVERALAAGLACEVEPQNLLALQADCLLRIGRPQEAASTFRRAVALWRADPSDYPAIEVMGAVVRFLGRARAVDRLVAFLEEQQRFLLGGDLPLDLLEFLLDVVGAVSLVARSHPGTPVRLAEVPATTLGELLDWARARAERQARAFDARNRSGRYARLLEEALALAPAPVPLDLTLLEEPRAVADERAVARTLAAVHERAHAHSPGQLICAEAEALAARGEGALARERYLRAVTVLREEGRLLEAGVAEAEAAAWAAELGDETTGQEGLHRAVLLLQAVQAPPELRARVARAWAPLALEAGAGEAAAAVLRTLSAELAQGDTHLASERAETLDALARTLLELDAPTEALEAALEAAEVFAGARRGLGLAHARWSAGRALRRLGRLDEAADQLRAAVAASRSGGPRSPVAQVADELVGVLQEAGREEEFAAVLRELGS